MHRELEKILDALNLSPVEREEERRKIEDDMHKPVRIIGIGQTGVGKTELLKSIFKISDKDHKFSGREEDFHKLETGAVKSVTKKLYSFTIQPIAWAAVLSTPHIERYTIPYPP